MTGLAPILEWFHTTMAGLVEGQAQIKHQQVAAANWRLQRSNRLWVTGHARDRFVERWAPGTDRMVARAQVTRMIADAVPTDEPCAGQGAVWRTGPVRFVVVSGRVVTVLPKEVAPDHELHHSG
jgi:hypothetical protein